MMRTSRLTVSVALLLVIAAMPAWAKPEVSPPEPVDIVDVFSGLCSFDVGFHYQGKSGAILFESRAIITAPGARIDLTNLDDTDQTVSLKVAGTFHDTYLDDEGNVRTVNTGRNLLFGTFDSVPGIFLTVGKVVTDWNSNDELTQFTVVASESPGKMIDVCAMLS